MSERRTMNIDGPEPGQVSVVTLEWQETKWVQVGIEIQGTAIKQDIVLPDGRLIHPGRDQEVIPAGDNSLEAFQLKQAEIDKAKKEARR